jgi:hypothetical protein
LRSRYATFLQHHKTYGAGEISRPEFLKGEIIKYFRIAS